MTEREKIEKLHMEAKAKYPDVTDKKEIEKLMISMQKKKMLWQGVGFILAAAVAFSIHNLMVAFSKGYPTTRAILLITTLSMLIEAIRTFLKYPKIDKMFEIRADVSEVAKIDKQFILKKHGDKLRNLSEFSIIKACVFNKNDEMEVGINNATWHEYGVEFKSLSDGKKYAMQTKKGFYDCADMGEEYYVILTQAGDDQGIEWAVAAYSVAGHTLSDDLADVCRFDNI